eukprot:SAG22_NODE_891_length_6647_cov_30.391723_3_plen_123_part_00
MTVTYPARSRVATVVSRSSPAPVAVSSAEELAVLVLVLLSLGEKTSWTSTEQPGSIAGGRSGGGLIHAKSPLSMARMFSVQSPSLQTKTVRLTFWSHVVVMLNSAGSSLRTGQVRRQGKALP